MTPYGKILIGYDFVVNYLEKSRQTAINPLYSGKDYLRFNTGVSFAINDEIL